MRLMRARRFSFFLMAALCTAPVFAHNDASHALGSFASGLVHPFGGLDHLLVMLAVGIWSTQQRGAAVWLLSLVFPLAMLAGAGLVAAGVVLPFVESGILASVAVAGLLVALALRLPLQSCVALVGVTALLHGQAHALELPADASVTLYGAGFVLATLTLHVAGLALGRHGGQLAGRAVGLFVTLCSLYLLAA